MRDRLEVGISAQSADTRASPVLFTLVGAKERP